MSWRSIAPLRHAVGPLLFLVIASRVDRFAVLEAVSVASPRFVAAAALVVLFAIPLRAMRWGWLLERMGHPLAWRETLRLSASATFAGTATPGRAGELYKAAPLIARGVPASSAVGSVLLDRFFDLALVAIVSLHYVTATARGATTAAAVSAGVVFVLIAAAGFLAGAEPELALRADRAGPAGAGAILQRSAAAIAPPASLASAALLTIAATGCAWLANHLLVRSLGLPLDALETAGISAAAALAALLPVSVLGIGTRDAALLVLLAPYGVEPHGAVALATLFLLLNAWTGLVCGIAGALIRRRS